MTAVTQDYESIQVTWDVVATATSYTVERDTDIGFGSPVITPTGSNILLATGLDPQTQYYFRATATNSGGTSGYSNVDDDTTENALENSLFRLEMNATDGMTPINAPSVIVGPARTDLLAFGYNGVDQFHNASIYSVNIGFVGGGAFSIMIRFRTTDNSNAFAFAGGSSEIFNGGFFIRLNANGSILFRSNANSVFSSATGLNDGDWHSFVITVTGSGGSYNMYVDGVSDSSGAFHTYNMTDQGGLYVAAEGSGGPPLFDGNLDDFYFANQVWTPAQILAAHNDTT